PADGQWRGVGKDRRAGRLRRVSSALPGACRLLGVGRAHRHPARPWDTDQFVRPLPPPGEVQAGKMSRRPGPVAVLTVLRKMPDVQTRDGGQGGSLGLNSVVFRFGARRTSRRTGPILEPETPPRICQGGGRDRSRATLTGTPIPPI